MTNEHCARALLRQIAARRVAWLVGIVYAVVWLATVGVAVAVWWP